MYAACERDLRVRVRNCLQELIKTHVANNLCVLWHWNVA